MKNNECIVDVAYTVSHFVAGSIYAYNFGLQSFENKVYIFILMLVKIRYISIVDIKISRFSILL